MGYFLGIARNVGHEMTFTLQKAENQRIITCSAVQSVFDHPNPQAVITQDVATFLEDQTDDLEYGEDTPLPHESHEDAEPLDGKLHSLEVEGLNNVYSELDGGKVYYAVGGIKNH